MNAITAAHESSGSRLSISTLLSRMTRGWWSGQAQIVTSPKRRQSQIPGGSSPTYSSSLSMRQPTTLTFNHP